VLNQCGICALLDELRYLTLTVNISCCATQFAFVRNLVVKNFYPVHSFLKPAAFDCGTLDSQSASATAHTADEASSELEPVLADANAANPLDTPGRTLADSRQNLSSGLLKSITDRAQDFPSELAVGDKPIF
jgi:hypothetical protein